MIIDALFGLNTRSNPLSSLSGNALANLLFGVRDVPLPTNTGKVISAESALGYSAVFRAITLMAGKYAQVPVQLKQRLSNGKTKLITDHPAAEALSSRPNPEMDIATFKKLFITLRYMRGQMFAEKSVSPDGTDMYLWPLVSPSMVIQRNWRTKELEYRYSYNVYQEHTGENVPSTHTFKADELLISLDFSLNGVMGISRITIAREAIALGLSYEEYASRFIGNDATPRGFIVSKANLKKETKQAMRDEWQSSLTGENRGKVGILDGEIDYKSTGMSHLDAQFLQSREFQLSEISRWFDGIPLHMLGDLSRSTNNNIEQQSLEFLTDCFDPLLTSMESSYDRWLLTEDEVAAGFYFTHDRSALQAADQKTISESSKADVLSGIKSLNEARHVRGLDPVEGGDLHYGNLGYGPLGSGVMTTNELREKAGLPPIEGADVIMGLKSQQPETPDTADPSDPNNALLDQKPAQKPPVKGQNNPPQAPKTGPQAAAKRALMPVFEDAFQRIVSKETLKLENLAQKQARSSTINGGREEIEKNIRCFVRTALRSAALSGAVMLLESRYQDFDEEKFCYEAALRHTLPETVEFSEEWRANRAKQRAEEELDKLLEAISHE